LGCHISHLR
jgi:hypothetical protein